MKPLAKDQMSSERTPFLGVVRSGKNQSWFERLDPASANRATLISQRHDLPELVGRILAARGAQVDDVPDLLDPRFKENWRGATRAGIPRGARQVGYALAGLGAGGVDKDGVAVPWQRVVLKSGGIAFRGDPVRGDRQRRLLEGEGVRFQDDRVPMHIYRWDMDLDGL